MKLKKNSYMPLAILVLFLPFCWATFIAGSIYRSLTILLVVYVTISQKGHFRVSSENKKLFIWFEAYVVYVALTMIWSDNFSLALNNSMGIILLGIIVFIFATSEMNDKTSEIITYSWVATGILSALLYLFGEKIQVGEYGSRTSLMIMGNPTDPNEYAGIFIITSVFSLLLMFNSKKKFVKISMLVTILLEIYVVFLTGSRGALLSIVVALFITLQKELHLSVKSLLALICVLIVSIFFIYYIVIPNIPTDILLRYSLETLKSDQGSGRASIWFFALKEYFHGPIFNMLFGYSITGIRAGTVMVTSTMHNQLIQNLISYGIVGFALYVVLLIKCFKNILVKNKSLVGAFIGIFLMSMTITMGPSYKPLWIFLMMGFVSTYNRREKE